MFLLKLLVVLQLADHPLLQSDAGLDTSVYVELATRVVGGDTWLGPGLYYVSPLYIYFLAGVLAVFRSLAAARILQVVLGTAAVGAIFFTAREWFGRRAAWAAAVLASLTGLFTFYESLVLQAALDPLLTASALAALALALRRDIPRWFFVTGLAFGIQAMNRPNILLAVAGVLGVLAIRRCWRPLALALAGVVLALGPLVLRNAVVSGAWTPTSSHGGLNFYIGNQPDADGTYRGPQNITPNIAGQRDDARKVAEAALGRSLSDSEVSQYFFRQGLRWWADEPVAAARLFVRKLGLTFSGQHLWLNYSYPFFRHDADTLLRVLVVGPWLLVPLGAVGLVLGAPRNHRAAYLTWAAFTPLYALAVALFFVSERYRLPLLVPLCIGGGAVIARLSDLAAARAWRPALVASGAVLLLAIPVNWPLAFDDGRSEQRLRMAEQLVRRGQHVEAEPWIARVLSVSATPAVVHFRIGRALLRSGQPKAALDHLRQAAHIDPRPEVSYALGQALLDANQPVEAVAHLRTAFDAGVRSDLAGFDLVRALAAAGQHAEAREVLLAVRPARDDDAGSWRALASLAQDLAATELAAAFLEKAVRADPVSLQTRKEYGFQLARLGRYPEAAEQLAYVVERAPADATLHLNLAVAYAQIGRISEARSHVSEALRIRPDYPQARGLLGALDKLPAK